MRWVYILIHSVKAAISSKLRFFFSLFSIALGVASITIIVAAVEGAYKRAYDIIDRFGPDSALVISGNRQQRAIGIREKVLTFDDMRMIRENFPTAYLVVPMTVKSGVSVSYGGNRHQTRIIGSTPRYSISWTWPIAMGNDFTDSDVKGYRNVCIIGRYVKEKIFMNEDPIGRYILVNKIPVRVIGVLSERGITGTGHNLDDRIIMPITTVMKKLQNETKYISAIRIRFLDGKNVEKHTEAIKELLRKNHHIRRDEQDDFFIITPKQIVKFLVTLTGSLVAFLGIVGGLSLVVSGFVITNLFLIAVKERSNEIGIRRAIGARKRDIMFQFFAEVFVITTAGAVAGFVLGIISSTLLRRVAEFPIHFSYKAFLASILTAWIIALLSGLQPARLASNMKPIEAIRA
jgi:putative ABC transport system permease protein